MKRVWMSMLALLLALCLTACGGTPGGGEEGPPESPDDTATSAPPSDHNSDSSLGGTYWTAVQHESYNDLFDRTEVSQMPTERWWADLFLNEDGTAQFREVLGDSFNSYLGSGTWWLGADHTLRLTSSDGDEDGEMNGRIEDGRIILESFYGDRFYFEKAERPGPGGELCIANLHGTWHMTTGEVEGWSYNAREEGLASTLVFESRWSDAIEGYVLRADYYFADFLDTDEPEYRQEAELRTELLEEPLFHGLSNELWSVRLFHDDTGAEFFLTLTDPDTLYLQEHYETDGAPAVRTAVYQRVDAFLPETLQTALYEEPSDCLTFYWPNPPDDVSAWLEVLPVTKLEPDGLDRLLVVGRWYETQIRFCTGEPLWDDSGRLLDWVTDEILYDETLNIDEPRWFSLTIPEGVPNLCLHIKRSWEDFWYLWPITDTNGYLVDGWTFLTP